MTDNFRGYSSQGKYEVYLQLAMEGELVMYKSSSTP